MKIEKEAGFTLVELLTVVAIIGVLSGIIAMNMMAEVKKSVVKEATMQLYSDLKKCRVDAMTRTSNTSNSRGFGFQFSNATTYQTFEFNDVIEVPVNALDAYHYGNISSTDTVTETLNPVTVTVPNNVQVSIASGTLTDPLLFDRRGWLRDASWSPVSDGTFILQRTGADPRCVVLSTSQIRQGAWNGTACISN